MHRRETHLIAVLVAAGCALLTAGCACTDAGPVTDPDRVAFRYEWHGNIEKSGFPEPSGIVFDGARGTLFVIGDEGDICEMTTDGKVLRRAVVRTGADFEGLARDPATGLLYAAIEGEEKIVEVDPATLKALREFTVPRRLGDVELFKPGGNGIEAICFVPDPFTPEGGTFFVANQSFSYDPNGEKSVIVELEVPTRSSHTGGEARILGWFAPGVIDLSGLEYDRANGHLLAISDATNTLMEMTRRGRILRVIAFPGNDQEGIALDDRGFMYIAQDCGGVLKIRPERPRFGP